jgi:hypothetical protein
MSLLDVLRSGVAIADSILKPLECDVTLERYIGTDGYGTDLWAPPVTMKAICDWRQAQVTTVGGSLAVSRVVVTFIDIKEMEAKTNGEGISDQDRITLPDGTTGPILDMAGFIDAGTGQPLATDVYLGGAASWN